MHITNRITPKTKLTLSAVALVGAAFGLVVGLLSPAAIASSIIGISSNIADVPGGDSLVLTVTTQNDGDIYELEVDHSVADTHPGLLPEFSVYADEADPYGGDGALFGALGVVVTYSAANSQWVIDFGPTVTDIIVNDAGGDIAFYLVLKDSNGNNLWGSMTPPTADSTFSFDLVNGTGDSLTPPAVDEDEDEDEEVVVPGVPNTSVVQ